MTPDDIIEKSKRKPLFRKKFFHFGTIILLLIAFVIAAPRTARALGLFDIIKTIFNLDETVKSPNPTPLVGEELKPFPFLSAAPASSRDDYDLSIIDNVALASVMGPLGNAAEAAEHQVSYRIATYKVRPGDTLSEIAQSFGVSVSTIRWANDIPRGKTIQIGQELVILPVSGVRHIVKRGDTLAKIATKYDGNVGDISNFNDIDPDADLAVGSTVIIPDGEVTEPRVVVSGGSQLIRGGGPSLSGYYSSPLYSYRKSQGLHGYNGVDLAAPHGTNVRAAAAGTAIVVRSSGWNGGYGNYIVIAHPNGTQTLYSHLSGIFIGQGVSVTQGQAIGSVGSTGKSTGNHLHFEVRGARNPF